MSEKPRTDSYPLFLRVKKVDLDRLARLQALHRDELGRKLGKAEIVRLALKRWCDTAAKVPCSFYDCSECQEARNEATSLQ
jgi:hypothetical protein